MTTRRRDLWAGVIVCSCLLLFVLLGGMFTAGFLSGFLFCGIAFVRGWL